MVFHTVRFIVDSSGNSVGIPDGSGGVTLTKAQYDAGVYLKPPTDFFGIINSISVSAVSRDTSDDENSNSTATTVVENISFTVAPPRLIMQLYSTSLINPLQNMSVVQLMHLSLWEWALSFQNKIREWQKHFQLKSGFRKKTVFMPL